MASPKTFPGPGTGDRSSRRTAYASRTSDLSAVREMFADLCEVLPGEIDGYRAGSSLATADGALMIEAWSTPVRYVRTALHIARGGLDHIHASLYLGGRYAIEAGRRVTLVRAGDIGLNDMAQVSTSHLLADGGGPHMLTVTLPRAVLEPLLAIPGSAHATVIDGGTPLGRLIRDEILALWSGPADAGDAAPSVQALAGLIALAVGPVADAADSVARARRRATFGMIVRHLDAQPARGVAPEALCTAFGVSRATLYRMFEPEGGLAHFLQRRRLEHAFARLAGPGARDGRLIDLAAELGFASDATFSRAFRLRFGHAPSEVRAAALRGVAAPAGTLMAELATLGGQVG